MGGGVFPQQQGVRSRRFGEASRAPSSAQGSGTLAVVRAAVAGDDLKAAVARGIAVGSVTSATAVIKVGLLTVVSSGGTINSQMLQIVCVSMGRAEGQSNAT